MLAPPAEHIAHLIALGDAPVAAQAHYLRHLVTALSGMPFACDDTHPSEEGDGCRRLYMAGANFPPRPLDTSTAGIGRMESLISMVKAVALSGPPLSNGSFLEAGVRAGGTSIAAVAAMHVYGGMDGRSAHLCDAFDLGFPLPREGSVRPDEKEYSKPIFQNTHSVGEQRVRANFARYGVPDAGVSTWRGFFVDSLPTLRKQMLRTGERLSILRLDGDMYDATVDVLYNLYDLLHVGGYVVIDDFGFSHGLDQRKGLWGAKDAVLDFRALHGIEDRLHWICDIDGTGAYFRKRRHVQMQRHRYHSSIENGTSSELQASGAGWKEMHVGWEFAMLERLEADELAELDALRGACTWCNKETHRILREAALERLKRHNGAMLSSLSKGSGLCSVTPQTSPENACRTETFGVWDTERKLIRSLSDCVAQCRRCHNCRFVSFSQKNHDCSWYSKCDLGALLTHATGQADDYVSVEVVHGAASGGEEAERLRRASTSTSTTSAPPSHSTYA
jgi:hypothetical protein